MGLWRGRQPWWQQGSYVEPVAVPGTDPAADPQVCVSFNKAWLPYIVGSLLQLVQPSSWATSNPTTLADTLTAATELIERFGTAGECTVVQFRFTDDCLLQYSTDGGDTWTTVPGWASFAPTCFTGPEGPEGPEGPAGPAPTFRMDGCNLQYSTDGGDTWTTVTGWGGFTQDCLPPGTPANPLGSDTDTLACSIAAYFASQVINAGIQHVLDEINDSKTLVQTVQSLLALGFLIDVPIALGLELGTLAFNVIQGLNLTDLQTGLSDTAYFGDVMCAIFEVIQPDGMITAANWAAVQAAIDAVTAPNAATASAVSGYVDSMSYATAGYLQQQGPIYEGDCSGCGTFAHVWNFLTALGAWTFPFGSGNDGHWTSSVGIVADNDSGTWWIEIDITFAARTITVVEGTTNQGVSNMTGAPGTWIKYYVSGAEQHRTDLSNLGAGVGLNWSDSGYNATADQIRIRWRNINASTFATEITSISIHGDGGDPF